MKKIRLGLLILFFTVTFVYAEKIRVWYMLDGTVSHTVCPNGVDRDVCIADALEMIPELQGVDYEDIEREDMPTTDDPDLKGRFRETWKRKAGGGIEIDQAKVVKIKQEKLIRDEMVKTEKKEKRNKAIGKLKAEGKLPEDYME